MHYAYVTSGPSLHIESTDHDITQVDQITYACVPIVLIVRLFVEILSRFLTIRTSLPLSWLSVTRMSSHFIPSEPMLCDSAHNI